MPTSCFGKHKKKNAEQDLEEIIDENIDGVVKTKKSKFKKFKKSSLKGGKRALGVVAQSSTKALSTAKTSFEKGADLIISNQEELEKAASLAFPGAGLAAKAAIEGIKVANKVVGKIPDKLPDKVQEQLDKLQDLDKVSTDLENKLTIDEDKSAPADEIKSDTPESKPNLDAENKVQTDENKNTSEDANKTVAAGEDQKPNSVEKN